MFKENDKVNFRYTGIKAVITNKVSDNVYNVILEDGEESIAFEEDIVHACDFKGVETSDYQKIKEKKISTADLFFSKKYNPEEKSIHKINSTEPIRSSNKNFNSQRNEITGKSSYQGLFLTILENNYAGYTLYFSNDTKNSIGFEVELFKGMAQEFKLKNIIPAMDFFPLTTFERENLNTKLKLIINIPNFNILKTINITIKKINGKKTFVSLMGQECIAYLITKDLNLKKEQIEFGRLEEIKQKTPKKKKKKYLKSNLNEYAAFPREIDIHADALGIDKNKLEPFEILSTQINAMLNYIEKAYTLGINEVYVIHGLGKGRLKEEVALTLKKTEFVQSFKNEYHERYGFGATKVNL